MDTVMWAAANAAAVSDLRLSGRFSAVKSAGDSIPTPRPFRLGPRVD
jgi:hypothetical protein